MRLKILLMKFLLNLKNFLLGLVVYFLVLMTLLLGKKYFLVNEVIVEGSEKINGLSIFSNKIIFFIDENSYTKKIKAANPDLKEVTIVKIKPNRIKLILAKEEPTAVLSTDSGYLVLSPSGVVLQRTKNSIPQLPEIRFYQKIYFQTFPLGAKVDYHEILITLFLLNKFNYLGMIVETVDISSQDMLIFKLGEKKYIFTSREKDKELQYQEFKTVLKKLNSEKVDYELIDFRFDQPVIKLR